MISMNTVRRALKTVCAAFALTVAAGTLLAPVAQANSGPYLPSAPSGHPSQLQGENRSSDCYWFFDCRYTGYSWNFCDSSWWSKIKLYKLEVDYVACDPCSEVKLVGVKLFSYGWDNCYCHYYFNEIACGTGTIKTCKEDYDEYRCLCFALNIPNDGCDTLFFEIKLLECGSWGWYHELSDCYHYYGFGLTPFCAPH